MGEVSINMKPTVVGFVCKENESRSVLAEALFKRYVQEDKRGTEFSAFSAGTDLRSKSGAPDPQLVKLSRLAWNLDISEHQAVSLTSEMMESAELVFAMDTNVKDDILTKFSSFSAKTYTIKELLGIKEDITVAVQLVPLMPNVYEIAKYLRNGRKSP